MAFRAVLFDLDGTLLDTLADIANACNAVLTQHGFPTHACDDYRQLVGSGVTTLFRRAVPDQFRNDRVIADCVAGFFREYGRTWNVETKPYDGIPELLDALTDRGLALAVLSNKPDAFTRQCVAEFLSQWAFQAVVGDRDGFPRKPDPSVAITIAAELGVLPEQFLYVGDTSIDMQTARAAGMRAIGVAWGFRSVDELQTHGADVIIQQPMELVELLK